MVGQRLRVGLLVGLLAMLAGCNAATSASTTGAAPTATPVETERVINGRHLYTPNQMRAAYGLQSLIAAGFTGKGQTVVVVDSFGSPSLQQDLDTFDHYYHVPDTTVEVVAPLGTKPFDPANQDMQGWAYETEEDVQTIHALAPDAHIVLLTSPVSETEGTQGLPEFLQLEQYAAAHYPGSPVSQSWNASEATLKDSAGQQFVQQWTAFTQQATTNQKMTFFSGSGDWGVSNYVDLQGKQLASAPTVGFPSDDPSNTAVGGTVLTITNGVASEVTWPETGGGMSAFFSLPSYQQSLPASDTALLNGKRGLPDVSASADVYRGLGIYVSGRWVISNGTSAGSPVWSALTAIANQKAGRPLGFLNPLLYKVAASSHYEQDFRDVTSGDNSVNSGGVQVQGYTAGQGWDAVTGLGSPIADHLIPDLIAASNGTL
jgi:subtilase family serine protease